LAPVPENNCRCERETRKSTVSATQKQLIKYNGSQIGLTLTRDKLSMDKIFPLKLMLKSSFFDRPDIQTHTLDKNLAL